MLIGRSGSGKTTLLRCINFLEEPTVGTVEVDGVGSRPIRSSAASREHREQIRKIRLRAGMVFQEFNLFPHMTVLQQLHRGADPRVAACRRDEAVAIAEQYLDQVGPARQARRVPVAPVGRPEAARGHRPGADHGAEGAAVRRADVARSTRSSIGEVLRVMEDLAHEGTTMIVVTHEMPFAREAADRVVFIEDGPIVEQGPPEQMLDAPREERGRGSSLRRFPGTTSGVSRATHRSVSSVCRPRARGMHRRAASEPT